MSPISHVQKAPYFTNLVESQNFLRYQFQTTFLCPPSPRSKVSEPSHCSKYFWCSHRIQDIWFFPVKRRYGHKLIKPYTFKLFCSTMSYQLCVKTYIFHKVCFQLCRYHIHIVKVSFLTFTFCWLPTKADVQSVSKFLVTILLKTV